MISQKLFLNLTDFVRVLTPSTMEDTELSWPDLMAPKEARISLSTKIRQHACIEILKILRKPHLFREQCKEYVRGVRNIDFWILK